MKTRSISYCGNRLLQIAILTAIFLVVSCREYEAPENNSQTVVNDDGLEPVWHQYFYSDRTATSFIKPQLAGDYVAFCTKWRANNKPTGVRVFNKYSGIPHHAWTADPAIQYWSGPVNAFVIAGADQDVIAITDQLGLYAMDLNTANVRWIHNFGEIRGRTWLSILNGNIIQGFGTWDQADKWQAIGNFSAMTGKIKKELLITDTEGYCLHMGKPAFATSANNDTIAYFAMGMYNYDIMHERGDIYAYNLSADSLVWKIEDIPSGVSRHLPAVSGNLVAYSCKDFIKCFDRESGILVWDFEVKGAYECFEEIFYNNGSLYAKTRQEGIRAFSMDDGTLYWKDLSYDYFDGEIEEYNGYLFFYSCWKVYNQNKRRCGIICLDETNGSRIGLAGFGSAFVIDRSNGLLFSSVAGELFCYDLNKWLYDK